MVGLCNNRNPLLRSGVSQEQRLLKALVPSYARLDERSSADLILFAKEYARYLNYYNDIENGINDVGEADGDWTTFMKMDVSVTLATLSKLDAQKTFAYFDFLINTILQTDNSKLGDIKKYYTAIFEFLYSLTYWLDEEWQHLPTDFYFTEYCGNMIQSRLNDLFATIAEYYKQSTAKGFININSPLLLDNAPIDISSIQSLQIQPLSDIWNTTITPFTMPVEGGSDAEKIKYVAQHSIFKGTIELYLKSIISLSQKSAAALEASFASYPKHAPHYTVYLTFIQLFRYAQEHLNDFTGRHLNFYYKNVLQLKNAPAQPDSVHLVMELAKLVDAHLLAKDTVFKAGKDVDGIEIFYAATNDVVLNKGQVKSIKSIFRKPEGSTHLKLYAAPVTNSGDGKGGDLTSVDKSWEPFGDPTKNDLARTGFAIAHSILWMKEGIRTLQFTFKCNDVTDLVANAKDIKGWFKVQITGPKGWTDLSIKTSEVFKSEKKIRFTIEIGADKPAVVPYLEKTHTAGYSTDLPLIEFTVNTAAVNHDPHLVMDVLNISNITIDIDVKGLKDASIQNELSALDAAKPFEIFGSQPHIGSSFIIGSHEVFLKNNDAEVNATLNIEWDKIDKLKATSNDVNPANNDYYFVNKNIRVKYLHNGSWSNAPSSEQQILHHSYPSTHTTVDGVEYHVHLSEAITLDLPEFNNTYDFAANQPFTVSSANGYMKIELLGPYDFGHGDFIQRFTTATLNKGTIPPQPYTPTVKSMSIDYTASAGIDMNNLFLIPQFSLGSVQLGLQSVEKAFQFTTGNIFQLGPFLPPGIFQSILFTKTVSGSDGHFYHLSPFGHAERRGSGVSLLPNFSNEGVMFIGLEQFRADQSVQILFQVSEGSANPLKDRQNIEWSYLSKNNSWVNFADNSVSDATNDLTQSGIIKFGFPDDATDQNSLMGEQLFWIKGAVKKDTDAICNIIQLYAQAVKVQFTDYQLKGNYYKNVLPASTISKLVIADAAIKKIQQPYSSFGGRVIESDQDFHTRVSERLRHKNRAITMWDYEHLVLQNFPEVYKVKCINHASIKLNADGTESDNELLPGHVVVVPVPDLRNKNAIDPLKPMTSIGVLTNINEFLKKHISPFVKLQVKNARFEEIQLDFRVKFNNDDGAFYHDVLQDDIEQFLSPWAFDAGADLSFGGSVYKSVLLNFVEERPYVDFVTCFKMFQWVDGLKSSDTDEAVATSARSVLVSYGGKHKIDYVNHDCNC